VVWTIFAINLLTIAVAFKKRMLLYAILNAIFAFLVTGQAFQIQSDLETQRTVYYLFNFISDVGFHQALLYVFGVSSILLFLALASRGYIGRPQRRPLYTFAPTSRFYCWFFLYLGLVSFLLIFVVVGLSEFLHSSRPGFQAGSTIFLVLLFVGVLPLLLKVICCCKVTRGDMACCLLCFLVTGWFSRIALILQLVAVFLAFYYERGWADAPVRPWLVARFLLFGGVVSIIFLGVGEIHDAQNYVQGSFGDLVGFIIEHPDKGLLSIQYNYRLGIEGMSGIAGIFTQYLSKPGSARWDYGASWILQGFILDLPSFLKAFGGGIIDLAGSLDWYPSSIIPSGAEQSFMSFGWSALLLYPLAVYIVAWQLPLAAMRSSRSPFFSLLSYVLMTFTISIVRGTLSGWIAFSLLYGFTAAAAWQLFRRYIRMQNCIQSVSIPS